MKARLYARPRRSESRPQPGLQRLSLSSSRDALLYVPKPNGNAVEPMPLAVTLHGAGGNERHGIDLLEAQADALGVVLLSPASRRQTWDIMVADFGPDVEFIDRALERTFEMCGVDPARVAIGGFSDGASYALSLGLTNGDLFYPHPGVLAWIYSTPVRDRQATHFRVPRSAGCGAAD